jgi:Zn-dependent protease
MGTAAAITGRRLWGHGALWLLTFVSAALSQTPLGPHEGPWQIAAMLRDEPARLRPGCVFAALLMAICTAHEVGHMVMARRYKVAHGLPYFLPAPTTFGTLGAVLPLYDPAPDRSALLRIAVAGPAAGALVALPTYWYSVGHLLTPTDACLPDGPRLGQSLITAAVGGGHCPQAVLGCATPAAAAGWVGLLLVAFNLLPMGTLDGGHIVFALWPAGHRVISWLVASLLGIFGATHLGYAYGHPGGLGAGIWLVVAVATIGYGVAHDGVQDGDSQLSRYDLLWATLAMGLCLLTWVPVPIVSG